MFSSISIVDLTKKRLCVRVCQLDELKMKDHQLALLDRNQYPDRGVGLPVKLMPSADCLATKDQDAPAAAAARQARVAKSDRASKHADLLQVNECQRVSYCFTCQWRLQLLRTGHVPRTSAFFRCHVMCKPSVTGECDMQYKHYKQSASD